jgi:hypothetical protein
MSGNQKWPDDQALSGIPVLPGVCRFPDVYLPKSVGDVLNIRIIVPTETGIATTGQSRDLLMNGLSQRVLCIRIKNWGAFF